MFKYHKTGGAFEYYLRDYTGKPVAVYDGSNWNYNYYGKELIATHDSTQVNFFNYDHLGSVRLKYAVRPTGHCVYGYVVRNANDYYPYGNQLRNYDGNATQVNYGYQGSEQASDLGQNHYVTHYRILETSTARWGQVDPVVHDNESPYISMDDNPVLKNDVLGNDINPKSLKAWNKINEGLTATLGKNHPFSYDAEAGKMKFNQDFDKDKYSSAQLNVINRFATLINSTKDVINVNVVGFNEKIADLDNKSLKDANDGKGAYGVTVNIKNDDGNGNITRTENVYLSRTPMDREGKNPLGESIFREARPYNSGLSAIHEIGGHAYLNITQQKLSFQEKNTLVEKFENAIRKFYNYNGSFIKGSAEPHE